MEIEKLVHSIIDPLVSNPESIFIRITDTDEHDTTIVIACDSADTAKLIGKHGSVANAIRDILSVAGRSEKKYYHVKFESFGEGKED